MARKEKKQKKKTSFKSKLFSILTFALLIAGVGVMSYPTVSNWWNDLHSSRAISTYTHVVEEMDPEVMEDMILKAHQYNDSVSRRDRLYYMTTEEKERYQKVLNIDGTGLIGYIEIKSIDVYIPIFHGTTDEVLKTAVGHVEWSSLPVGGEGTHSVLSGHRGLPKARLFTDLDRLSEGDVFTVTVLNKSISYEIDQIRIVYPEEIDSLTLVPGEDYCTLVTCTPYGVNTQRLLVRGRRIAANENGDMVVEANAYRVPNHIVIPAIAIPLLILTLTIALLATRPSKKRSELQEMIFRMEMGDDI